MKYIIIKIPIPSCLFCELSIEHKAIWVTFLLMVVITVLFIGLTYLGMQLDPACLDISCLGLDK